MAYRKKTEEEKLAEQMAEQNQDTGAETEVATKSDAVKQNGEKAQKKASRDGFTKKITIKVVNLDPRDSSKVCGYVGVANMRTEKRYVIRYGEKTTVPRAVYSALKRTMFTKYVDERDQNTGRLTGNKIAQSAKKYSIELIKD